MLKNHIKRCLVLILVCTICCVSLCIHAQAATTLTISQPDDWEHISKSDPPSLKWNSVSGAAGYRITVKDYVSGKYYTQNEWTTSRSYSLEDLFDETMDSSTYTTLKIWVGAMQSSSEMITIAEDFVYLIVAEVPDVTRGSVKNITSDSATLYMSVDRDYGSAILDSGFYLGTSSTVSKMTKYSFQDYGSFSATSKGEKYMTISGLEPDTKYYYRAYAVNHVGEEYTTSKSFYTEAKPVSGLTLSAASYAPAWNSTSAKNITVSGVSSYTYTVSYSGISAADMAVYDYQWLKVTQSGTTLSIQPSRPNYSASARTAIITVSGGGSAKTVTVTQAACGEAAPTLTAKAGTQVLANGDHVGQFLNTGDDTFYLSADITGVRKVTVNFWKSGAERETKTLNFITDGTSETLSCYLPILSEYSAGDYYADLFASNSNVANDYWAMRPSSVRVYFTVVSSTADGELNFDHITGTEAERIVKIAESLVKKEKKELHFAKEFGLEKDPDDWCASFVSLCAQKAGLSDLFVLELATTVDGQTIAARRNANPASLLRSQKATVYYFYNSYKNSNGVEWTSVNVAPGKTYDYFLTGFTAVEDLNRAKCVPQPGDLIFFKKSSNNAAWAHVGLVTKVNNSTGYLEFIDGNNYLNGNMLEGYNSTAYVNKKFFNNWQKDHLIMAIAHPHYSDDDITEIPSNPQGPTVVEDFAVDYDANGGTGAPARQIGKKGAVITLSTQKPTRSGYTFQGWATSASASTAAYQPGDQYTISGGQVLYAVWQKNEPEPQVTPLKITVQPKSATVIEGSTAKITLTATGDSLTYNWYIKKTGDSAFKSVSTSGNSYSFTMAEAYNGCQVYCRITDKHGNSVDSNIVTMTMGKLLKITQQPKTVYARNGEVAQVSLNAYGDGLTYQWFVRDVSDTEWFPSKHTSTVCKMVMSSENAGRKAYCEVTDQYGNTVRSNTVELRMTLCITAQPKDVQVASGAKAKTTFTAEGEGLTYQWYWADASSSSFASTTTFKSNYYEIQMNDSRNGRRVYCIVTDRYGKTVQTDTVTLNMNNPLKITAQPKSVTVANGTTAKVTLTATGEGLTYKWYYKNASATKFTYTSSFTGNTYSVKMDATRDGRKVYCVVSDKHGNSVTSSTVTLSMEKKTPLAITQQPKSVTVAEGATAKVTLSATGDGLTYRWYYKDAGAGSYTYTSSFTGNYYSVTMNSARNGRRVLCKVYDKYGNMIQSSSALLSMKQPDPVKITVQPQSVTVAEGVTAKVTLTAVGEGLTYKWYYKNAGASKFTYTSTYAGNSYSAKMDSTRDGRQVYCVITDKHGNSVTSDTVTLSMEKQTPLTITQQPKSVTVTEGEVAKVTVKATGDGLTYRWYYKNAGESSYTYTSSFSGNSYSVTMNAARAGRRVLCKVYDKYGNMIQSNSVLLNMK